MAENRKLIPKKQRAVLLLVKQGYKPSEMAIELNINLKKVYRLLNKLQKKRYIINYARGEWRTTEEGDKSSLMGTGGGETSIMFPVAAATKKKDWVRLHNVQITIRILKAPKDWDNGENSVFFRNQPKNFGNTKYLDLSEYQLSGRIYRKSIVINLPEITKPTIEEAEEEAFNILFAQIRILENRFRLTLIKDGYLNMKINKNHYALIHNDLAKTYREKKQKLHIYHKDGKLRLTIDFSKNEVEGARSPEFEATHSKVGHDDINVIKQFFEEIVENPFMPKDINLIKQQNALIMGVQEEYAKQIRLHLKVQEETLKTLKAIQESLKKSI